MTVLIRWQWILFRTRYFLALMTVITSAFFAMSHMNDRRKRFIWAKDDKWVEIILSVIQLEFKAIREICPFAL